MGEKRITQTSELISQGFHVCDQLVVSLDVEVLLLSTFVEGPGKKTLLAGRVVERLLRVQIVAKRRNNSLKFVM